MNENRALWRSLHFLSKPFSLGILLILLVNDSILRHFWPSTVTGKLSDLAWLFLAPVVVTAGLALVMPKGLQRHEWALAGIGFGATAAAFVLFKTLPVMRAIVLDLWQAGLGFPAAAVLDPTDLAALIGVIYAAWLWRWQRADSVRVPLRAVFVIPLLAVLTLADAAAPDYGIACLENRDGQIMAYSSYHAYATADGGLTWQEENFDGQFCPVEESSVVELSPEIDGLRFRYQPGQSIENSPDGLHWTVAYSLEPLTEADRAYYQKIQTGNPTMRAVPLAGLVDPQHATVIFAMGHEGVLVRQSNGDWTWVGVGSYLNVEATSSWAYLTTVLNGEIVLSAALILLILSLGAFLRRRHLIWTLLIWTGWLGWGLLPMIFPPALSTLYLSQMTLMGTFVIAALAFLTGVIGSLRLMRVSVITFLRLTGIALIGGILYFLPYGLWAFNLVSQYYIAESLALVLGCGAATAGMVLVQNLGKTVQK